VSRHHILIQNLKIFTTIHKKFFILSRILSKRRYDKFKDLLFSNIRSNTFFFFSMSYYHNTSHVINIAINMGGSLWRPLGATATPSFNINIILGMIDQGKCCVPVVMRSLKPFYVPSSIPWHPP